MIVFRHIIFLINRFVVYIVAIFNRRVNPHQWANSPALPRQTPKVGAGLGISRTKPIPSEDPPFPGRSNNKPLKSRPFPRFGSGMSKIVSKVIGNQKLTAIRKFATEVADTVLLNQTLAKGILRVKCVQNRGERVGNWIIREQAQELLNASNVSLLKGSRDRAILSLIVGGGFRKSEVTELTLEKIQM